MSEEEQLPTLLADTAQAVVDDAKRLGLTWTLRPGTVTIEPANPTVPHIIFDGDTVPVGVVSLMGSAIPNDRVMGLQVPPGGNYIVGRLAGTPLSLKMTPTFRGKVVSTGDVTIGTASQFVTPLTTLTLASAGEFMVTAFFDLDQTVSGGNNFAAGALQVDGVGLTEQAFFGVTGVQRATVGQVWHGSLTAGAHTFRMITAKSLNIGTFICRATNTGFAYQIWQ